jgi:hypothetical protein
MAFLQNHFSLRLSAQLIVAEIAVLMLETAVQKVT